MNTVNLVNLWSSAITYVETHFSSVRMLKILAPKTSFSMAVRKFEIKHDKLEGKKTDKPY